MLFKAPVDFNNQPFTQDRNKELTEIIDHPYVGYCFQYYGLTNRLKFSFIDQDHEKVIDETFIGSTAVFDPEAWGTHIKEHKFISKENKRWHLDTLATIKHLDDIQITELRSQGINKQTKKNCSQYEINQAAFAFRKLPKYKFEVVLLYKEQIIKLPVMSFKKVTGHLPNVRHLFSVNDFGEILK